MKDNAEWLMQVLKQFKSDGRANQIWMDKLGKDMGLGYSYGRGYYNDTRGDEVATAVLEAYSKGIEFDTLLQKNKAVRAYWAQVQAEKIRLEQERKNARERQRKLAEKRAIEQAKREEVMAKLTQEEIEALGLAKKGKK